MSTAKPFLVDNRVPPPRWQQSFSQTDWNDIRSRGIAPLHVSELSDSQELRAEFVRGAELLGLGKRRMPELLPQMLLVADAINAGPRFMGILMPRRSSKTTSLFCIAMGRIASRPGYLISYAMMTTATKARLRFRQDIVNPLEALFPDKASRPFKINLAGGSESVTWFHPDGEHSVLQFVAPKGEAFRSDAWDLILLDEAGEASVEMGEDVMSGALATMDTRLGSTLITAGTAGEFREGNALWDTLEDGRLGRNRTGIVEYAAPSDTSVRDIEDWDKAKEILLKAHPGIGTLTDIETMESNYLKLRPEQFLREYVSIFGKLGGSSFIDYQRWLELASTDATPSPPAHFRMAFAVHKNQTSASIVAAWRVDGVVHLGVLAHREGVAWLKAEYLRLARKYRVPVVADKGESVSLVEIQKLEKARPKPQFETYDWNAVSTAAASLLAEIDAGTVVHHPHDALNEAVRVATKRGTRDSKKWAFGRGLDETNDITALEAASLALRAYDNAKPKVPVQIIGGYEG